MTSTVDIPVRLAVDTLAPHINKAMNAQTFSESARAQAGLIKASDTQQIGAMSPERWQTLVDQLVELKAIRGTVVTKDLYFDR